MKTKLVPSIRFKGFTNAWELINISNVVEYGLTGGTPYTQNPEYYNGNIPFLNISDITENDGKYLTKIKKTISLKAVKNTSAKLIEQQHLIVGMYASIGKIAINKHNLAISQAVIALKFKKTYDLDFYYFLFYKKYINNEWNKESLNGVQSNLTKKTILDLPHKTTNIKEQNKISTLLNYFYKIVSLLQRKLKMLENIKNTLLEKMFASSKSLYPSIRFKGFTNAWELKRLGELCKGIGGVSLEKYFNPNGKYNVINIGSYGVDGEYNDQLLRINKNNISQNYLLNKDDLVMVLNDKTMEGNILGKVLYIDKSDKFIYNQRTQRLIIDETKYNSKYIYYLMYSKHTRYKILSIKQGTSQIYINWSEVEKLSLNITSNYKEQCFIHKLFENLKTNVLLLQRKLKILENIKNTLLKKMFV